ncbi:hypothetical protein JCM33374_g2323 [Metschnikowia sp. JCM 33374]|nr:hypothetical protein JCM33374_g2323 [Metschnikowia sp. JCM 33374]
MSDWEDFPDDPWSSDNEDMYVIPERPFSFPLFSVELPDADADIRSVEFGFHPANSVLQRPHVENLGVGGFLVISCGDDIAKLWSVV